MSSSTHILMTLMKKNDFWINWSILSSFSAQHKRSLIQPNQAQSSLLMECPINSKWLKRNLMVKYTPLLSINILQSIIWYASGFYSWHAPQHIMSMLCKCSIRFIMGYWRCIHNFTVFCKNKIILYTDMNS